MAGAESGRLLLIDAGIANDHSQAFFCRETGLPSGALGTLAMQGSIGAAEKQLGDCPDFRAAKMGLSPSEIGKLFLGRSLWMPA